MTVSPRTASYDATLDPALAPPAAELPRASYAQLAAGDASKDRKYFAITVGVITLMYVVLQNPYWVPAGDSEVYIAIGRSLALGQGYVFNGQPVAMVPPGWPAALAVVMSFTSSFLVLKLFTMACMIAALAVSYWVARRFVSPGWAVFVILSMAVTSHVYQATFWLISEGLFCLVTSWSLLVAMHIRERWDATAERSGWWRPALLVGLCVSAVLVRWAGVLGVLPIAAILMNRVPLQQLLLDLRDFFLSAFHWIGTDGKVGWRYAWNPTTRIWVTLLFVSIASLTTFKLLRDSQRDWSAGESAPLTAVGGGEESGAGAGGGTSALLLADRLVSQQYSIISGTVSGASYSGRFTGWGRWFSWLYYQPFRAGMGDPTVDLAAQLVGWFIIGLLVFLAGFGAARNDWMWLALLVYAFMLAFNWPNVNARYYVPVAFLLTIGLLKTGIVLRSFGNRWWRASVAALLWLFLGSFILLNVVLWAVDVKVARSDDYYAQYEAGLNESIISANRYLVNDPTLRDGEVAVTPAYTNMGRRRPSQFALRCTNMLTGKAIINVPRKRQYPPSNRLARWCQLYGIRYYLHQHPISPWRVWHYRVPEWWQERVQGHPVEKLEAGWKLFRVVPGLPEIPGVINETSPYMVAIETPPSEGWPTRVPGLE